MQRPGGQGPDAARGKLSDDHFSKLDDEEGWTWWPPPPPAAPGSGADPHPGELLRFWVEVAARRLDGARRRNMRFHRDTGMVYAAHYEDEIDEYMIRDIEAGLIVKGNYSHLI